MPLFRLFLLYVKIGAILLGGGYVILPIMQNEFAEKRKLISSSEIIDCYALSQSLPGIVAANMSMFIGYKLKGKLGALVAMFGIVFVPFWLIVLLATVLSKLVDNMYVQSAFGGVGVAVVALILLTIREMWQKTDKDAFFYIIFILASISLIWFNLTPVQTIIIFSILGIIYKQLKRIIIK